MTRNDAIEQLQICKGLIKQDGQDYLDERDFPLLDMAIEALQTDLVRCKDCRWYEPLYKDKEYDCPQGLYAVYENDFCSHGERREP